MNGDPPPTHPPHLSGCASRAACFLVGEGRAVCTHQVRPQRPRRVLFGPDGADVRPGLKTRGEQKTEEKKHRHSDIGEAHLGVMCGHASQKSSARVRPREIAALEVRGHGFVDAERFAVSLWCSSLCFTMTRRDVSFSLLDASMVFCESFSLYMGVQIIQEGHSLST